MANARPSSVRPSTRGISRSSAVTSARPRIAELRIAGYQKSQRNPGSPAPEFLAELAPKLSMENADSVDGESFITLRHPSIGQWHRQSCRCALAHRRLSRQLRRTSFGVKLKCRLRHVYPVLLAIPLPPSAARRAPRFVRWLSQKSR